MRDEQRIRKARNVGLGAGEEISQEENGLCNRLLRAAADYSRAGGDRKEMQCIYTAGKGEEERG